MVLTKEGGCVVYPLYPPKARSNKQPLWVLLIEPWLAMKGWTEGDLLMFRVEY